MPTAADFRQADAQADGTSAEVAAAPGACVSTSGALFDRTYGSAKIDGFHAVIPLPDGGHAAVGGTYDASLAGAKGDKDFLVVRTKADGQAMWKSAYGGSNFDEAFALAVLPGGEFLVAGRSRSADVPDGPTGFGAHDLLLLHVSGEGNITGVQRYGASGDDVLYTLKPAPGGGFILGGETTFTDLPGSKGLGGGSDAWLVRLDANGGLLWQRNFGGSQNDSGAGALCVEGGCVLAGTTDSVDLPGKPGAYGLRDFWLLRTDQDGNHLWSRTFGGTGDDIATGLTALPDGGFAMVGSSASGNLPGSPTIGGPRDFQVVRTDSAGKLLWLRTYGGSNVDEATGVAAWPDGSLAIVGSALSGFVPGGGSTAGGRDGWLVVTAPDGNLRWSRPAGGGSDDAFDGVRVVGTGVVIAGRTASKGAGSEDAWLLRLDAFGNVACSSAGACADGTIVTCDDGKPCTVDRCDAAHGGCWHADVDDGVVCGLGLVCQAGLCQ